jgi:hypothetical protein
MPRTERNLFRLAQAGEESKFVEITDCLTSFDVLAKDECLRLLNRERLYFGPINLLDSH